MLAVIVFYLSICEDAVVSAGFYGFIYTLEYGYIGFLLIMARSRFIDNANIQTRLRASEESSRALLESLNQRIDFLMHEFDLANFTKTKAGLLSSGEMSRLNLAKTIINEPCLLLLDEPTASLDPSIAELIREKIKQYVNKEGAAILWTSHNMREIELVCDQVLFLSHGKILLSGDPKTLPARHGKKDLEELFIAVAREPLSLEK